MAVHERALEVAAELGAEPGRPLLRSRVMSALCSDDFVGAETMARDLHAMAGHVGDPAWVLECEYLLGIIDFWSARVESAAQHFASVSDGFDPAAPRFPGRHLPYAKSPLKKPLARRRPRQGTSEKVDQVDDGKAKCR